MDTTNDFIVYDDIFSDKFAIPARYSHYSDSIKEVADYFSTEVVNSLYRHSSEGKFILLNSGGLESVLLDNILYHNNVDYTSYTLVPHKADNYNSTAFIAMQNYNIIGNKYKLCHIEDQALSDSATYCNSLSFSRSLDTTYDLVFWDLALQSIDNNLPIVSGGFLRDIFNSFPQRADNHKDFDNKFNDRLRNLLNISEYNIKKVNNLTSSYGKKVIFPFHNPALIKKFNELNMETLQDSFLVKFINEVIKEDDINIPLYHESPGVSLEVSQSIDRVVESSIKERYNLKRVEDDQKVQRLWLDRYNSPQW